MAAEAALAALNRNVALAGAILVASASFAAGDPACAESIDAGAEAASNEVRAGISWSGGRASASADARIDLGVADVSLRMAVLRGAVRHGGADVVADIALGRDWSLGAVTLRTEAIGHVFGGAAQGRNVGMDYGELGLGARYGIGPLRLSATAWYAPSQSTIGGDNLHLRAAADAGLPGLPITLLASAGYTTGSGNAPRAARLRPHGDYADWKLGAEYSRYPLTFGLDYTGTDIAADRPTISPFADPAGGADRIVARVRFSF